MHLKIGFAAISKGEREKKNLMMDDMIGCAQNAFMLFTAHYYQHTSSHHVHFLGS